MPATDKPLTFGSLFAGIGGLDLGLEHAGLHCAWQVEINDYARRILKKHWPAVRRWDDVRTFPPKPIGDWRCDLIAGGDPCQENSNSRRTHVTTAPSLGAEFIRVVDLLRPRLVLRENPTVVRKDAPWPWFRFRNELERLGYTVLPFRLRACCFGFDHRRDRLFLLAESKDAMRQRLEGTRESVVDPKPPGRSVRRLGLSESDVVRKRDGVPYFMDRIRCLGNAVVPAVAEWIGARIIEIETWHAGTTPADAPKTSA